MGDDDLAARILARLDAIERHIGMSTGETDSRTERRDRGGPARRERFGQRRRRGGYDGPSDEPRDGQGADGRRGCNTECRFNEKRTVDKIVELITERLEEMLRLLPQLIQIETRPARDDGGKPSESKQPHAPA